MTLPVSCDHILKILVITHFFLLLQMNRDPRVRGILRNAPQVPLAVNPEPHPQAEDLLIELPTLCDTGVVTFPKSLQLMANGTSCACKGVKCRGRTMTYAAIAP